MTHIETRKPVRGKLRVNSNARPWLAAGAVVVLLAAMALNTKVIRGGSDQDTRPRAFSAAEFGAAEFPGVQAWITERAVDAKTLADAIAADATAAAEQYGVKAGVGSVIPVTFTGQVGEGRSGIYTVAVDGLPAEQVVRVQTGPAINGTELRDATGEIGFGRFTNQIEYQNAAAALNDALKTEVLSGIDAANLTGKTITVVGAFTLINPKAWLVTPVSVSVQ
jgi:predicted lipoprotein